MADDFSRGVDLFGDPIPLHRGKAGRPPHEWTLENSNKINLLFAMGSTPEDAALAIGVTMPTFRKHYFSELAQWKQARLRLKAKQLQLLAAAAATGKVAAIKEMFAQIDKAGLVDLSNKAANRGQAASRQTEERERQPRKGKKEERSEAAHAVTGMFAPPPSPRLVN